MLRSAMGYLAAADATAMEAATQASVLGALASRGSGETSFPQRAWLVRETGVTAGTATGHAAWARRAAEHPQVIEALAEGHLLSESVARTICTWTDKLPADCRVAADAILIVATKTGADV